MLDSNTPVAVSATDSQCEETSMLNGPLQVETGRRAEAMWPPETCWLPERALSSTQLQNLCLNAPILCKAQCCAEMPSLSTE